MDRFKFFYLINPFPFSLQDSCCLIDVLDHVIDRQNTCQVKVIVSQSDFLKIIAIE